MKEFLTIARNTAFSVCFGLAFSAVASAAWVPVTEVREMAIADVRLPAHEADQIVLSRCADCKPEELRVTADTRYRVGGADAPVVSLSQFQSGLRRADVNDELMLLVTYTVDNRQVTDVVLNAADVAAGSAATE